MNYPDERLTDTSKYSHAEICETLDRWYDAEAKYNAALNALPESVACSLPWLEPVVCPSDGVWHRAGNAEMFPVQKWRKLIKQHERLTSRIRAL